MNLQEKMNAAKEKLKEESLQLLDDEFAEIFAQNPALKSFGWIQYTPYFMDGDPCYFGAATGNDCIEINENDVYELKYEADKVRKAALAQVEEGDLFEKQITQYIKTAHV